MGGTTGTDAVLVDVELSAVLAQAVGEEGLKAHRLPSGAGHDAAQMAALVPVAMLFVRCEEGISHNPAESVAGEDPGRGRGAAALPQAHSEGALVEEESGKVGGR